MQRLTAMSVPGEYDGYVVEEVPLPAVGRIGVVRKGAAWITIL
jgi:hypothetical protein